MIDEKEKQKCQDALLVRDWRHVSLEPIGLQ